MKWLLAIPHYIVLLILVIFALVAIVVAWFAILITARYPRAFSLRIRRHALLHFGLVGPMV